MIETANKHGSDVMFDRFPYIAYQTGLSNLFPLWARDGGSAEFLPIRFISRAESFTSTMVRHCSVRTFT
jgi:hypothetical protein